MTTKGTAKQDLGIVYLTEQEAAQKLHVHPVTIWRQVRQGNLKKYKFASRTLYRLEDIENSIVEALQKPTL